MNSNKKRGLAVLLTLIVITVLIYSGSVTAITVGISDLVSSITGSNDVSFLAKVDLHTDDVLLTSGSIFNITIIGGSVNYTCIFDINGTVLGSCPNITVSLQSSSVDNYTSNGNLYGYGFDGSSYDTTTTVFGGFGYAYTAGTGEDTYTTSLGTGAELIFNITWATPTVEANTTYTIDLSVAVTSGETSVRYVTLDANKGTIVIVSASQGATDAATVTGVRDALTYALITMDDNADARYRVISNLYLPTSMSGVTISWASNNSAINTTGGVTRNSTENKSVLMTASLSKGSASSTKLFYLVVKKAVTASVPDSNGTINVTGTEVKFNSTTIASVNKITASKAIASDTVVSIDVKDFVNSSGKIVLNNSPITLQRDTSTVNYTAEIQNGTIISGGSNWNGIINLPTVKTSSSYTAPSGSANIVIDMGSGVELNFSQPVKITLPGMAGKGAAWTRGNTTLIQITTICNSATNPTNINATTTRECYIASGSDLIIWTYHFTLFAAYTPAVTPTPTTTSGGGSSSTSWDCDEWGECINGRKSRDCTTDTKSKTVTVTCDDEAEVPEEITGEVVTTPTEEDKEDIVVTPTTEDETEPKPSLRPEPEPLIDTIWIYTFICLVVIAIVILLVELRRNKGIKF